MFSKLHSLGCSLLARDMEYGMIRRLLILIVCHSRQIKFAAINKRDMNSQTHTTVTTHTHTYRRLNTHLYAPKIHTYIPRTELTHTYSHLYTQLHSTQVHTDTYTYSESYTPAP